VQSSIAYIVTISYLPTNWQIFERNVYIFCFHAHYKFFGTSPISRKIQRDIIIQAIRSSSNVLDIFGRF